MQRRANRRLGTVRRPVRAYSDNHLDALRWNEVNAWVGAQTGTIPTAPPYWWVGSSDPYEPWDDGTGPYGYSRTGGWLPAVTRATEVLLGPLLRMPWRCWTGDRWWGTPEAVQPPSWITDPQLAAGSVGMGYSHTAFPERLTRHDFWSAVMKSALWYGRGIWYYRVSDAYVGAPQPGTARVLHPSAVETGDDGTWTISGLLWGRDEVPPMPVDSDGYFTMGAARYRLAVLRGPGVLAAHAADFGVAQSIRSYTAGQYSAGIPAGYLKVNSPNLAQEQADALRAAWLAAHGGDRRSIAVLSSAVEFNPIAISPVDAELVEARRSSLHDISLAFNLDPQWLGVPVGGMTYSNNTMNRADLVDLSIAPLADRLEEHITTVLPVGQFAQVDFTTFRKPIDEGGSTP